MAVFAMFFLRAWFSDVFAMFQRCFCDIFAMFLRRFFFKRCFCDVFVWDKSTCYFPGFPRFSQRHEDIANNVAVWQITVMELWEFVGESQYSFRLPGSAYLDENCGLHKKRSHIIEIAFRRFGLRICNSLGWNTNLQQSLNSILHLYMVLTKRWCFCTKYEPFELYSVGWWFWTNISPRN